MYNIDMKQYSERLIACFEGDEKKQAELSNLLRNLVFKLEKNIYHYNNIKKTMENTNSFDSFFSKLPLYFEIESIFVSMRSTIDMFLHLINFCFDLDIPKKSIHIQEILSSNIPQSTKNILSKYTDRRNNKAWSFVYSMRNEIVHENSIIERTQLYVENFEGNNVLFMTYREKDRNFLTLCRECFKLLDRLTQRTMADIERNLKLNSPS